MPGSFFDTNVLVYSATDDPLKGDRAGAVIREGGTISVQVLNEFANVARIKLRRTWRETHEFLSLARQLLDVRPVTIRIHEAGLELAERYGFATYDAMIVAAALDADCSVLWSEDMQDGMLVEDRLRIVDPFRPR